MRPSSRGWKTVPCGRWWGRSSLSARPPALTAGSWNRGRSERSYSFLNPFLVARYSFLVVRKEGGFVRLRVSRNQQRATSYEKRTTRNEQGCSPQPFFQQNARSAQAGLKEGDIILAANGQAIRNVDDLHRFLAEGLIGRPVTLTVLRGREQFKMEVTPREAFAG